jgi:hypothetical protein
MGGQSDADPHLLSQAAAIQGEGLTYTFCPKWKTCQGMRVCYTSGAQKAKRKTSARKGNEKGRQKFLPSLA